jgi:hypothetical protein
MAVQPHFLSEQHLWHSSISESISSLLAFTGYSGGSIQELDKEEILVMGLQTLLICSQQCDPFLERRIPPTTERFPCRHDRVFHILFCCYWSIPKFLARAWVETLIVFLAGTSLAIDNVVESRP